MDTQTQNPQAPAATAPVAAPVVKTPKSASIKLIAPEGTVPGSPVEMLILGYKTSKGWRMETTTYTERAKKGLKRAGTRGGTVEGLANIGAARAKVEAIAKLAIGRGWVKPEVQPLGIVRKEDAFDLDNLPVPVLVAKKAKK